MPVTFMLFLLASASAPASDATCDAKPFTLGTVHKPETKPAPKPAPKVAEVKPPKPVQAQTPKPGPAGIAPCKDPKK